MKKFALLLLFLFNSCSLISVNTCGDEDFTFVDAGSWPECVKVCESQNRNAYGADLFQRGKEPEFECSCGAVRTKEWRETQWVYDANRKEPHVCNQRGKK